jgi:hypothetical protein
VRAAQGQANAAENAAESTGAEYGASASNISSVLEPFLQRELTTPGGISQQDQTAMLSASQAGAGGVAGSLATKADERAAATGNASGVGASMDDIAREREKAAAGASSNIANENTETKLKEQQEGAQGLGSLYGTDVGAQLKAMGVQTGDINAEVNAGSHGWLQNFNSILNSSSNLISAIKKGGGGNSTPEYGPSGGNGDDEDEDEDAE